MTKSHTIPHEIYITRQRKPLAILLKFLITSPRIIVSWNFYYHFAANFLFNICIGPLLLSFWSVVFYWFYGFGEWCFLSKYHLVVCPVLFMGRFSSRADYVWTSYGRLEFGWRRYVQTRDVMSTV